jgi:two-component system cell cycle response regulator
LVGNSNIVTECRGFEDTRAWSFYDTMEEAKANLGKSASKPPVGAAQPVSSA